MEKGCRRQVRSFLSRPIAVSVGTIIGAVTAAAFLSLKWIKKLSLANLERENEDLGNQVASLSNENKTEPERLLGLSHKVLDWQGKYARNVNALSAALEKCTVTDYRDYL